MVILMISDNSCHNMEPSWISMTGLSRTYFIIDKIWQIQSRYVINTTLHTYTVMRPDNAFSALYNNTEQRANIRAKTQYLVFARILSFLPAYCVSALSRFCDVKNDQWASGVFNQRIASDYYIVTSYLNAINLLNYNDICLYKQYAILCQQNVSAIRWSY